MSLSYFKRNVTVIINNKKKLNDKKTIVHKKILAFYD